MGRLSMRKISEVFRQRYALKRSYRDIAQSLNISISTIYDYLARAKTANITWPLPEEWSEQQLYDTLFLPVSQAIAKRPLPEWEEVHCELRKKGMTLRLLWREYREVHANGLGYTQFCERYRVFVKTISPVMRQHHKGGEKTFVDYAGMTMPWMDPATGEIHEAQIFVGALGASQLIFAEATATQQLPDWIESHIRMWEYFGVSVKSSYRIIYVRALRNHIAMIRTSMPTTNTLVSIMGLLLSLPECMNPRIKLKSKMPWVASPNRF